MTDQNPIDVMCQEVVELVTDYLGQALPAEDRVRFEKHILTCPPCTTYLAQMRTTIGLASRLGDRPPAAIDDAAEELIALFRTFHGK
jgi:anti-sigma factor RsiW